MKTCSICKHPHSDDMTHCLICGDPLPKLEQSEGGPSSYYDFPYSDWKTTNDQMEYLAEHKWGKYGIHLKDIFKGLCRWNTKKGTSVEYDCKKIIYYGVRVLRMIVGNHSTRLYLYELLDDPQFKDDPK